MAFSPRGRRWTGAARARPDEGVSPPFRLRRSRGKAPSSGASRHLPPQGGKERGTMPEPYFPPLSPITTGIAGKCPRCGRGRLFAGYLALADHCENCGLPFHFADAGDGAAWFVMLFVCFVGVGSILAIEAAYSPPFWVHVLIAIPFLVILPLILLRP